MNQSSVPSDGMTKEATIFFDHIVSETFANAKMTNETKGKMLVLMQAIVETLQDSIGSIDFWTNADKQKKARSNIKTALLLTDVSELKENRERVAIEIMKLAKNRHDDLLKGNNK